MREKVVAKARSFIGIKESNGSHKYLIDVYNGIKPLPVGYKMSYSDPWCAAFVSAVGQLLNLTDIIFPECSCERMINLYKSAGLWQENDSYVPKPGDIIFYDWQDNGLGDNLGASDHVGIVEVVSGTNMTIIEGNISDSVGRRNIAVDARYIRGYGLPNYSVNTDSGLGNATPPVYTNNYISTGSTSDEQVIWNFLMGKLGNAYGVAGLMGNLYAESALKSNNLQDTYERSLGYTDSTYTSAVDNGAYNNFVYDCAGYGIAQWTHWSRKKALLDYAKTKNKSIGDLTMQLEFLIKELSESYKAVMNELKTAGSIFSASNSVLLKYEIPYDRSSAVQNKRASFGQTYYNKYASGNISSTQGGMNTGGTSISGTIFKTGDIVSISADAVYYTGGAIPSWVKDKSWVISSVNGNRAVINKSVDGKHSIMSPINTKYLVLADAFEANKDIWIPKVGDIVIYNGNIHYGSAMASDGYPCKGGKAKITQIYQLGKSKHPYHLVKVSGEGATVYGWVDEGSFIKA